MNPKTISVLLCLILVVSFVFHLLPIRTDNHFWDETVYLQNAGVVLNDPTVHYDEWEFRPPLFPLLLAGLLYINHSLIWVHIIISLLSMLVLVLTFTLGKELFSKEAGLLATLLMALSIVHTNRSHDLLVDAFLPILWLASALYLYRLLTTPRTKHSFLAGLFVGLSIMTKYTSLILALIHALILYVDWSSTRKNNLKDYLLERKPHAWMGGIALTLIPYLLWSWVHYGNPVHTFLIGLRLSGAADPFWNYFVHFGELLPWATLIGVVLLLTRTKQVWQRAVYVPLIFFLGLYLPMQALIPNKDLRFLLPAMPFLALLGAQGFIKAQLRIKKAAVLSISIVLILLSFVFVSPAELKFATTFAHDPTIIQDTWHPPTEQAALWLQENTQEGTLIYTNYQWPVLAYYSQRPIQILGIGQPPDQVLPAMREEGYVIVADDATQEGQEEVKELVQREQFTIVQTFDNEQLRIYRYEPS